MQYIYCLSNESIPGKLNIIVSAQNPDEILDMANTADDWRPPTPYVIEIGMRVMAAKEVVNTLYHLLDQCAKRVRDSTFFTVSVTEVELVMEQLQGTIWKKSRQSIYKPPIVHYRDMSKCFADGQRIRHVIAPYHTVVGEFKAGRIFHYGTMHQSLRDFARYHYRNFIPYSVENQFINGWYECECEIQGQWKKAIEVAIVEPITSFEQGQRIRHSIGNHVWIGKYETNTQCIRFKKNYYQSLHYFRLCHWYLFTASCQAASIERFECEIQREWYPIIIYSLESQSGAIELPTQLVGSVSNQLSGH
jgi:hypothetical protein